MYSLGKKLRKLYFCPSDTHYSKDFSTENQKNSNFSKRHGYIISIVP